MLKIVITYIIQCLWWVLLALLSNWIKNRFGDKFNVLLDQALKNIKFKFDKKLVTHFLLFLILVFGIFVSNFIYDQFSSDKQLINQLNIVDKYVLVLAYTEKMKLKGLLLEEKERSLIEHFNQKYVYLFDQTACRQAILFLISKKLVIPLNGSEGTSGKFERTIKIAPKGETLVRKMWPNFLKEIDQIMNLEAAEKK